jgi:CheY-like chemotaxis protein
MKSTFYLTLLLLVVGGLLTITACRDSAADKRGADNDRAIALWSEGSALKYADDSTREPKQQCESEPIASISVESIASTVKSENESANSALSPDLEMAKPEKPLTSSFSWDSNTSDSLTPEPRKLPNKINWDVPDQKIKTSEPLKIEQPQSALTETVAISETPPQTANSETAVTHVTMPEIVMSEATTPEVRTTEAAQQPSETAIWETLTDVEVLPKEIAAAATISVESVPIELAVSESATVESVPSENTPDSTATQNTMVEDIETRIAKAHVYKQDDADNPFDVIKETASEITTVPTLQNETFDENVWENSTKQQLQSLENLEIKTPKPPTPLKKNSPEQPFPDIFHERNDLIPPLIRNELENQESPAPFVSTNSPVSVAPSQTTEIPIESKEETAKENVAKDNSLQETPVQEKATTQGNQKPIEFTIVPTVPSIPIETPFLPNLQPTEQADDNPFGVDFDIPEPEKPADNSTTKATTPTKDDFDTGLDFSGLNDNSTTSENPTDSATPASQPKPTDPVNPNASSPGAVKIPATDTSSQSGIPMENAEENAEPLSEVEKYLINEAKRSPVRQMESIELLYKLNKPKLAKHLLRQFLEIELTPEDCLQINKQVNAAILLRISVDEAYQPEGGNAVRKIVEGAKSYFESRIAIEQALQMFLTVERQSEKENAAQIILNGRETAIEFLLDRLAKSNDDKETVAVSSLLFTMNGDARHALQESLATTSPLGMRAARILAQLGHAADARFLLPLLFDENLTAGERADAALLVQSLSRKVPSREEAAATLYSIATNYYREKVPFRTDENYNVPLWKLQMGDETPKYVTISEQDASRYFAEKFAKLAVKLDSSKPAYKQLERLTFFDLKGAELGSDNSVTLDPAFINAVKNDSSVVEIEAVLRVALQQEHPIAARVAVEILGQIGTADELIFKRGQQSPLVKAAGFSDRRVRFAAIASIMKLDPQKQYAGSSVVSQSLIFFSRATGIKRAIVASSWDGDANRIAGYLAPLGYKSEIAAQGRQAMQLAIDSADTELMMLDTRTPNANVEFLVQDMRADNRTHDVPIAVMAADGQMPRAQRAAYGSKMAHAYPRPTDEESTKQVVENLLKETGVEYVPSELRLEEAKKSITWIADLYQRSTIYRFENIEQIAYNTLGEPELMVETLQLLKQIPTPTSQQMMSQIISNTTLPIEKRQHAVDAFRYNAQRFGILIRGRLILDLYDAYNASGTEPVASQQARSTLLDIIEEYANYMQKVNYKK